MKSKILPILAISGLTAWWLWTRKSIGDKTKLIFKKISYAGGLLHPKLLIDFQIDNPTNQTGTISAISGEVYVNDKSIADFSSFGDQIIKAKSSSPLRIEARPTLSTLTLLTTKGWMKKGLSYKIKGSANLDGIVAPFEYTGKF